MIKINLFDFLLRLSAGVGLMPSLVSLYGLIYVAHAFFCIAKRFGLLVATYLAFIKNVRFHAYAIASIYFLKWIIVNILGEMMSPLIILIPSIVLWKLYVKEFSLLDEELDETKRYIGRLERLTPITLLAILSFMAIIDTLPPFFPQANN